MVNMFLESLIIHEQKQKNQSLFTWSVFESLNGWALLHNPLGNPGKVLSLHN